MKKKTQLENHNDKLASEINKAKFYFMKKGFLGSCQLPQKVVLLLSVKQHDSNHNCHKSNLKVFLMQLKCQQQHKCYTPHMTLQILSNKVLQI